MMMAAHQFPERMMTNDVKTTRFSTITKTRGRRASRRPRRRRACNHPLFCSILRVVRRRRQRRQRLAVLFFF